MSAIHTVVAGIDFSENAKDAVDAARELVRLRDGHVHLLHVVPDVRDSPWTVEAPGLDLEAVQRSWCDDAEEGSPGSRPTGCSIREVSPPRWPAARRQRRSCATRPSREPTRSSSAHTGTGWFDASCWAASPTA
jgi:hypothetical protein